MNKIMPFYLDYDIIHSILDNKIEIDRKNKIKLLISSLEQLRIRGCEDKIQLSFISDKEEFESNITMLTSLFSEMIKDEDIVLGNHFSHRYNFSSDGTISVNTENELSTISIEVIGDKIYKDIKQPAKDKKIERVRIAKNNIGSTILLSSLLEKYNIQLMQYKFNPFITTTPVLQNIKTNYNQGVMYANWYNIEALITLLNKDIDMEQPIKVYK